MRRLTGPDGAGGAALASAVMPPAFLLLWSDGLQSSWFDVVLVGAPMLLIPGVVLAWRRGRTLPLKVAVVATLFGLAGFMAAVALLPFQMLQSPVAVPEGAFVGLLSVTLLAGIGILLSSLYLSSLPRYLPSLGTTAAAA